MPPPASSCTRLPPNDSPRLSRTGISMPLLSAISQTLPDARTGSRRTVEVSVALKPGGCVMILGPDFPCPGEYYDYFDHHLALTEKSVGEAIELAGFHVELALPRTLPYSFRGRLPSWPWTVASTCGSPGCGNSSVRSLSGGQKTFFDLSIAHRHAAEACAVLDGHAARNFRSRQGKMCLGTARRPLPT